MKRLTIFCLFVLLSIGVAAAQQTYTISILGTLGGNTSPAAINDTGDVVGSSDFSAGPPHAFLWTSSSGMQDIGGGTVHSVATALNNSDQVVGYFWGKLKQTHAFLWTSSSGLQDLGELGGCCSAAYSINNKEEIVGTAEIDNTTAGAFYWTLTSGMQILSAGQGAYYKNVSALAVNDNGYVAGYGTDKSTGKSEALLWSPNGAVRNLGDLTGGNGFAWAFGINNSNNVIGMSLATNNDYLGFQFPNPFKGSMQSLGTLASYTSYTPLAINNSGVIVGSATCPTCGWSHAFVYTSADGLQDLNSLVTNNTAGWLLTSARSINSRGQITVQVVNSSGTLRAGILTPTASAETR